MLAGSTAVKGEKWNLQKFIGNSVGGGAGATIGGFFGPGSGTLAKNSPFFKQKITEFGMNFAGGVVPEGLTSKISGEDTNLSKLLVSGEVSASFSQLLVTKASRSNTLNQASWTSPSTLQGMFSGVQSRRMWQGGTQGALISTFSDITVGGILKGD